MRASLPNVLTFSRGIAAIIILLLFFTELSWRYDAMVALFVFACFSDFLDGRLARKWGVTSDFGAVFDPLFDKVLVLSLIMLIYPLNIVHPLILFVLFLRDITTDVFKNYLLANGITTPAIYSAKLKTTMQMVMLGIVLVYLSAPSATALPLLANITGAIAAILSVWSGYIYVRRGVSFMNRASTSSIQ